MSGMSDCISREAVKELLFKDREFIKIDDYGTVINADDVDNIPSVQPCGDAVSREAIDEIKELMTDINGDTVYAVRMSDIRQLPSVIPKQRLCKDCKFFEYDSVVKVDGIPLIVAHEICTKWGNGCKTSEDGYCFLFEPKEGVSE